MLRLYTLVLYLLAPWLVIRLLLRGLRNSAYWRRWGERVGSAPPAPGGGIWIHAVSVGEVLATAQLVKALRARFPGLPLIMTTMTPTGSAQVRRLYGDGVVHCYVPYDYPPAVRRFLARLRPRLLIVMETELWPNIFHFCASSGVPVVVANLRMSERSMRAYQRFTGLARRTLANVSLFAVQSRADAERMLALGAPRERVRVTGSIKFEINLPASQRESAEVLRGEWGRHRPIWLAASTHEGEEELVLDAYRALAARFPDQLLVLVPRHPERFPAVARLCRRAGFNVALRSERRAAIAAEVNILIGDTMGELSLFYGACDVAFIGGSLVRVGGHNLLEAAAVGTPTVFGPQMFNFQEIAEMAVERGASVRVADAAALAPSLADFLGNANRRFEAGEAGRRMIEENRGALDKTMSLIAPLLDVPARAEPITAPIS